MCTAQYNFCLAIPKQICLLHRREKLDRQRFESPRQFQSSIQEHKTTPFFWKNGKSAKVPTVQLGPSFSSLFPCFVCQNKGGEEKGKGGTKCTRQFYFKQEEEKSHPRCQGDDATEKKTLAAVSLLQ